MLGSFGKFGFLLDFKSEFVHYLHAKIKLKLNETKTKSVAYAKKN